MASTVPPPIPNSVYIVIRLKMADNVNNIVARGLCWYYGDTYDDVIINDLVHSGDMSTMYSAIRHCRHLVKFRFTQNKRLYLSKVLNRIMDHEIVKISIYVINLNFCNFK